MDKPDLFKGEVCCPDTLDDLLLRLRQLHGTRAAQHEKSRAENRRRKNPRGRAREQVLKTTGSQCHICGALIDDTQQWQADHVLAHSGGGPDSPENFLPAHRLCNNYRWDYGSEEFQWILKMGVWARTLIKNSSPGKGLGRSMAESFFKYDHKRQERTEKARARKLGYALK
jgi:hypothetical protein